MAKREKYEVTLTCSECEKTEVATVSEFENPVHERNPDRQPETAPENFTWDAGGTWAQSATFKCNTCGRIIAPS